MKHLLIITRYKSGSFRWYTMLSCIFVWWSWTTIPLFHTLICTFLRQIRYAGSLGYKCLCLCCYHVMLLQVYICYVICIYQLITSHSILNKNDSRCIQYMNLLAVSCRYLIPKKYIIGFCWFKFRPTLTLAYLNLYISYFLHIVT